jgi:predicted MPP superfamily phosphohydrolase
MGRIIIPDIHGRNFWKRVNKRASKIIFLADYVDSFSISAKDQYKNLLEIIAFKKQYPDKVVLLWGNHDVQYLYLDRMEYRCSGYQDKSSTAFSVVFNDNKSLFQNLYFDSEQQILYSHAGLQNSLYNELESKYGPFTDMQDFVDFVNQYSPKEIFNISKLNGGFDEYAGIFWTRPVELQRNGYPIKQVVGHTYQQDRKVRYINNLYAICDIAKIIDIKDLTF